MFQFDDAYLFWKKKMTGKMEVFVEILNTFQDQPKKLVVFSKVSWLLL